MIYFIQSCFRELGEICFTHRSRGSTDTHFVCFSETRLVSFSLCKKLRFEMNRFWVAMSQLGMDSVGRRYGRRINNGRKEMKPSGTKI